MNIIWILLGILCFVAAIRLVQVILKEVGLPGCLGIGLLILLLGVGLVFLLFVLIASFLFSIVA